MKIQGHNAWTARVLLLLAVGLIAGESNLAFAGEVPASDQIDFPERAQPGPNDLTWNQVADIKRGTITFGEDGDNNLTVSCTLNTGPVYKRASGNPYPYGDVGAKPKTICTVPMVNINHTTNMYKTVWWGLQHVGGPFKPSGNFGTSSYEQKSVEVICADLRNTTFRMIITSVGTFPGGQVAEGSAYEEATVPCGTNP